MSSRLVQETSPYLLQHAENPVDWYAWGDEALSRARLEDKPIFLSIGYSACHWCHVMAHESFEDEDVARVLNEHFVNIKVDREERPDLDQIYMSAVQQLTGSGGWPMSVFLTPEGKPFYGGTYFPPEPRYNLPGFRDLLEQIAEAWETRRDEIERTGQQLVEQIAHEDQLAQGVGPPWEQTLNVAVQRLEAEHDDVHGGWGPGPKFPQPMALEFLLRTYHRTKDEQTLSVVEDSLEAMARGGIYDQIGGGFHRYSVDARWLVPHFEKMLYDNAQLARVYLHAWQITGKQLYRAIAEETLDYMAHELRDPAGGFYSAQDADVQGEEGLTYLWTPKEIEDVLGDDAERFVQSYPVTQEGNFEGRNILTWIGSPEERSSLAPLRNRLLEARQQRPQPERDEKVLTAWNGLALAALAEAGVALKEERFLSMARQQAVFLLDEMRDDESRMYRTWSHGQARLQGYLDDHAHLIDGLIALYQADWDLRWLRAAQSLADQMLAHYWDDGFYDTADDHEDLIVRPRNRQDNALPSGGSMASLALLQLARFYADDRYVRHAEAELEAIGGLPGRHPTAFGQWLLAIDHSVRPKVDVAIIGDPEAEETAELIRAARAFDPQRIVAVGKTGAMPLLDHRHQVDGRATAYVCIGHRCLPEVTDAESLADQLEA